MDAALKQLAELNIKKTKYEGEQTLKINEIKEDFVNKSTGINTKIKEIEKNIEKFADSHKSEFLKVRSKKLNYGTISYRIAKKVSCSAVKDAISALKALNLDFCIRTKSELDKDRILECDEKLLLKAGISIKTEDKVKIEPNFERIAAERE